MDVRSARDTEQGRGHAPISLMNSSEYAKRPAIGEAMGGLS